MNFIQYAQHAKYIMPKVLLRGEIIKDSSFDIYVKRENESLLIDDRHLLN